MNLTDLADERFISITTFKRDGSTVSTPVWCVGDDGALLVFSEADSWKVRRIRHDRRVRITPCSARGRPHGDPVEAEASIAEDTARVQSLLSQKYGWTWRGYTHVTAALRRFRGQGAPPSVTIRIVPR